MVDVEEILRRAEDLRHFCNSKNETSPKAYRKVCDFVDWLRAENAERHESEEVMLQEDPTP